MENEIIDIRDRIRYLREGLGIKQNEMSLKLGLKQGSLSDIERKKTKVVTDRLIKLICSTFNVNEEWLRTGEGDMFEKVSQEELDRLADRYSLPPLAKKIVQAFVTLETSEMNAVLKLVKEVASACEEVSADKEDGIESKLEAYRAELEAVEKGTISSVLPMRKESIN